MTQRIFVAGATGVIGRRAVAQLVAAGHEVTGMARSGEKAELLRSLGATPARVTFDDPSALTEAVVGHDVVINLATHIPPVAESMRPGAWAENDHIRTHGSARLVDAAVAAGVTAYIQESITFTYPDGGDEWIDEDATIDATKLVAAVLAAEASAARFTEGGGTGIVLRFGMFIAAESAHTRDIVAYARRGIGAVVGHPDAYQSSIHADDAAAAVVAALDAPAGTFNVVDDDPVTKREYAALVSKALGRRTRIRFPGRIAKFGGRTTAPLVRSQRVSNRKFKETTGWAPRYRSAREAWPAVVAEMPEEPRPPLLERLVRPVLALLALSALGLGVQALAAPRRFYENFPFGRGWIAADGPYNAHLITDFGGLNLGLAVVLLAALFRPDRYLVRTAALAAMVVGVPHLTYHALNLDPYGTGDAVATIVSLSLAVLGPAVLVLGTANARH